MNYEATFFATLTNIDFDPSIDLASDFEPLTRLGAEPEPQALVYFLVLE